MATLYRDLLGRTPSREEVADQLASTSDWRVLVAIIVGSDEYHARRPADSAPRTRPVVNIWHPQLAAFGHQPGLWSDDGEAVIGTDGWLFLARGTNAVLDQYRPDFPLPDGWTDLWAAVVDVRRVESRELGAELALVIVPDKASVLREHLPSEITLSDRSPASVLSSTAAILYPLERLATVPGGAYLRTDTHLSLAGNEMLARTVLTEGLGVDAAALDGSMPAARSYPTSGDLGRRFEPSVVEVVDVVASLGRARIMDDNMARVTAAGKHVGMRCVLQNEEATDQRTAVVFGDSYSVPKEHYQGLAWSMAQVFREVHFVWSPFGWDRAYMERVGAQVAVCETAERFVPRPPPLRVDVTELVESAEAFA